MSVQDLLDKKMMKQNVLDKAYTHCVNHGYRFTDPRERVLKILVNENKPLGAYEILQRLSQEMDSPKPPTVYRAIQFWHQEGFIHCIDSLKSYVACTGGHHVGQAQFFICSECDFVQEVGSIIDFKPVTELAHTIHFTITSYTVEIKGLCANCHKH